MIRDLSIEANNLSYLLVAVMQKKIASAEIEQAPNKNKSVKVLTILLSVTSRHQWTCVGGKEQHLLCM